MTVASVLSPRRISKTKSTSGKQVGWFDQARFGMFVHWGLYSLLGRGEWVMHQEKIPASQYNKLSRRFGAEKFDANELVKCAVDAGAKYVVLTSRHHDGFCLWNSKITDFNSVNSKAGRDLIAEYVVACRRAGLRVGIYYSIMSWQHEALHKGPYADPVGWEAMVQETHGQLRELMSNYGRIDMLWYDGGFVPGLGDADSIAKYWRSKALNAMIRKLQPNILINDRSGTSEDFSTPEQHIVPAPPGRRWEACMTINDHWGYCKDDRNYKSIPSLVNLVTTCARYGGNFLLNIGPRGDGSIPSQVKKQLNGLGAWMNEKGHSIYGSERTAISEANLGSLVATTRDNRLFLHRQPDSCKPVQIGMHGNRIVSCESGSGTQIKLKETAQNTFFLEGNQSNSLIEIKLERSASKIVPAKTLLDQSQHSSEQNVGIVFGSGKYDPEPETVVEAGELSIRKKYNNQSKIKLPVAVPGRYRLEIGVVGTQVGPVEIKLNGRDYVVKLWHAHIQDTLELNDLILPAGDLDFSIKARRGEIELYGVRLEPAWHAIDSTAWETVGPFPTRFTAHRPISDVKTAMQRFDTPQLNDRKSEHLDAFGRNIEWTTTARLQGEHSSEGVNFPYRVARDYIGVCFARTQIISPDDRDSIVQIGVDWWANAWINGKLIQSDRKKSEIAKDGSQFNAWRPKPARIRLKRGNNLLLVKCHPGTAACWFTCWISNPGDLKIGIR